MMESLGLVIFVVVLLCYAHSTGGVFPGGLQSADKGDNEVQRAAEFAICEIKNLSGLSCKLVCIDDVKSQVVSGVMYHLKLTISINVNGKIQNIRCFVKVWVQPWMPTTHKLHYYKCSPKLSKT